MSLRSEVIRILNEVLSNSKKITELPAATTPLDGTEWMEVVQGGVNKKVAKSDVSTGGGGGGGTWGSIAGTLSDQTDLNSALSGKEDAGVAAGLIATEVTNRNSAISTAISTEVTDRNNAIAAVIIDSIADSDTTHAPSRNAVFDALALKAPLASPTFIGTPAAPTAAAATNTTQVATTAFVQQELASAGASGDESELSLIATFQYLTI